MKTIIVTLCLLCALTNGLLCADWVRREETFFATIAAFAVAVCAAVARLAFKLRY